jgi:hypothetical protein
MFTLVRWVNSLNQKVLSCVDGWRLLQLIRWLIEMNFEVKICHSYLEANKFVADLANINCDECGLLTIYEYTLEDSNTPHLIKI